MLTIASAPAHLKSSQVKSSCLPPWQLLLQLTTLSVELINLTLGPNSVNSDQYSEPLIETASPAKCRKIEASVVEQEDVSKEVDRTC